MFVMAQFLCFCNGGKYVGANMTHMCGCCGEWIPGELVSLVVWSGLPDVCWI
jgi:hypothetical protein